MFGGRGCGYDKGGVVGDEGGRSSGARVCAGSGPDSLMMSECELVRRSGVFALRAFGRSKLAGMFSMTEVTCMRVALTEVV